MGPKTPKPSTPPSGIWAPALTFFTHANDTLDLAAQKQYFTYLSKHLTGLVILGTNAETFLLTREERAALLKCAREAVGPDYPLMAGVGGHSTKQVLEYISDAAEAGMDYVLVLPCAYFGKATGKVVSNFYEAVVAGSPLPVVLYNFPGVTNGSDLDSDVIAKLAEKHPGKITGVKLTCASVGKITRLAAQVRKEDFAVFGGQSDFLIAGLSVGSAGCIAAFANVFPKVVMRVYELWQKGEIKEALELHQKAALAERACKVAGIAGTKYAAALTSGKAAGIEGAVEKLGPRAPYEPIGEADREAIRGLVEELSKVEESL